MRKYIFKFLSFVSIAFLLLLSFTSCNDYNDLGLDILPGTDLINVKNVEIKDSIIAYANEETGIVTSKTGNNLLGNFNDPLFGTTNANFATQLRTLAYPDFGTNPVIDSSFLFLYYASVYGDEQAEQHIKVYELLSGLDADAEYTQEIDLKSMASAQILGELSFTPIIELDSIYGDTIIQLVKIPLDNSISQKILDADSLDKVSNDAFLTYFKGLYIESESNNSAETGSLITLKSAIEYINALGTSYSVDTPFYDLQIYYKNEESLNKEDPDTLPNGLLTSGLYITEYSARVSNITHNYAGTAFANDLDQQIEQENNIYIQPTGGLKSRVWIGGLSGWRDSVNVSINKAELVFQVDTIASDITNYPPPANLTLTFVDKDGEERLPIDYFFSPYFYDGSLDTADYTYHFNITQHVQRVINVTDPEDDNYVGNQGFYLTTGQRANDAKRVVLEGTKRENGVKFVITYSEYLK